jgi:hypothetical protein
MSMTSSSKTDGAKAFAAWHNRGLTKKRTKRSRDPSQLVKAVVDIATGKPPDGDATPRQPAKDPAAAALGRKAGKARASRRIVI